MNYEQAIQHLFSKRPENRRPGSLSVQSMARSCGSPQLAYPTIHVTGTNGKGSVSLKIVKALESAGLKVGLFTSPHLISFCERVVINSVMIPEQTVLDYLLQLFPKTQNFCFFEIATLLAFEYFRDQKVDVAVIEAGIGGLLDSTNIVHPLVSIITSVAKDHEDFLGKTLDEIAYHKAGIIKPGVPVVIGPQADLSVIREKAASCQSPLYKVEPQPGFYDFENGAIARQALDLLKNHFPLTEKDIEAGLKWRPPCRFEQRGRVIFDVAHNPAGIKRLLEALDLFFPGKRFSAVIGMSKDKDVKECLLLLASRMDHLYLVRSPAVKAMSIEEMSHILRDLGYTRFTEGLDPSALDEYLLVCGSFYIMKQVREEILRIEVSHDDPLLTRSQPVQ